MKPVLRLIVLVGGVVVGIHAAQPAMSRGAAQTPTPQQTPVFRGRTTVVPIDVRVVDKDGKPITDLKASDFTIFENGVRHGVDYFSTQALTADAPGADVALRPMGAAPAAIGPANRRLFLIVLGRGRLQDPSMGVDATIRFVKDKLLPQDQVAVMAWNRATDFSADKTKALAVLERFRARHEEVEHEIALYFTGLFGLYDGQQVPAHVQKLVDAVFEPDPAAGKRTVLPTTKLGAAQEDFNRITDNALTRSQLEVFRLFGTNDNLMSLGMFDPTLQMSFDDYIVLNRQTMQDVGNLYAGIDYLRFIDGEKHLVFVTEQGFFLPRADYERDLARLASDARVVLDIVQTGGVWMTMVGSAVSVPNGLQLRGLRDIAEITGGQSAVSKYADAAYDRIVAATTFSYVLGYTPVNLTADNKMRDIKVQVNRKGATVAYRRAYIARPMDAAYDPRESMATTRLMAAAGYAGEIGDLPFTTKQTDIKIGVQRYVNIDVTFEANRLRMARVGDKYVAALSFSVVCGDYYQKEIGQLWESRDVYIPADEIMAVAKNGVTVTLRVPVKQPPVYVKVMAYDYGSDRVGSKIKVMK